MLIFAISINYYNISLLDTYKIHRISKFVNKEVTKIYVEGFRIACANKKGYYLAAMVYFLDSTVYSEEL